MLARIFRQRDCVAGGGADIRHFVRRHCRTDSRAVNDNADFDVIFADRLGDCVGKIGIINRVFGICAKIADIEI